MIRALLLAACLGAPEPDALGQIELQPGPANTLVVRDASGDVVATAQVRPDASTVVHVPAGTYSLEGEGKVRSVVVGAGSMSPPPPRESGTAAAPTTPAASPNSPARLPPGESPSSEARLPPGRDNDATRAAWRAPLMAGFVPGLGHAWAGKPGWGVGVFAATLGATIGAVSLGLARDPSDGATPSDADRSPGYARLGGLATLSSIAAALYVGQIFDAHRLEHGQRLRPRTGRVQLRVDRLSAVAMAPGRPRAALYDDFSLAALVRVSKRVRVGPADASVRLGPQQTVLSLGARATAQLWGPDGEHPHRRWALSAGGGVLGQMTTQQRLENPTPTADDGTTLRTERVGSAVPYVLSEARLFVAPRWSVGALGRFGVPLMPRRYADGRALPAFAPTLELGVSLGVNL